MSLTREQYDFLASPLDERRVAHANGQSHLEQWDVRRHLIRCFGYGGYDLETRSLDLVAQIEHATQPNGDPWANHKARWTVVYRAEVRLVLKDASGRPFCHFEDGAIGDAQNQPALGDAHDLALKTALSQALKRCAVNLGDQFGLSLYRGGSAAPVVLRSLVLPPLPEAAVESGEADG